MWLWIYSAFFAAAAFIVWTQHASQESIQMLGNIIRVTFGISLGFLELIALLFLPIHFGIQVYALIRRIQGRPL